MPTMLSQLTTLIYNMDDIFFVSLTQQPAMIATVPFCTPILLIIMSIACVFGMGGSSVIARLLGKWRKENAGKILNFSTYAMCLAGLVTLGLGLACLPQIDSIAGADAENMAYTCDYLLYTFLGAPFIMLSNGFVHLFRSAGLVEQSTVGLVLGNAVNIVLDYVFILPLGWGRLAPLRPLPKGFCAPALLPVPHPRPPAPGNPLFLLSQRCLWPECEDGGERGFRRRSWRADHGADARGQHRLNNDIANYGSDAVGSYGIDIRSTWCPSCSPWGCRRASPL